MGRYGVLDPPGRRSDNDDVMPITSDARLTRRARITSQHQITVPKAVRDALGARPGDALEFERRGDTFVVRRRPRVSVLDFAGIAAGSAERLPADIKELKRRIRDGMAVEVVAEQERIARDARRERP